MSCPVWLFYFSHGMAQPTKHSNQEVKFSLKESAYKSYDELPLFLNADTVAKTLGVSPSSGYELMRVVANSTSFAPAQGPGLIRSVAPPFPTQTLCICAGAPLDFPTLRIGSRIIVPKEKFIQWVEQNTGRCE